MYKLSLFFSFSTGNPTDFDKVLLPLLCGQVVLNFRILPKGKKKPTQLC